LGRYACCFLSIPAFALFLNIPAQIKKEDLEWKKFPTRLCRREVYTRPRKQLIHIMVRQGRLSIQRKVSGKERKEK
jgi:hypothetical protein